MNMHDYLHVFSSVHTKGTVVIRSSTYFAYVIDEIGHWNVVEHAGRRSNVVW